MRNSAATTKHRWNTRKQSADYLGSTLSNMVSTQQSQPQVPQKVRTAVTSPKGDKQVESKEDHQVKKQIEK